MKRSISAILLVILLFSAVQFPASADTVRLPKQLKTIEAEAFFGDKSITEAVIPDGVKTIGARAFAGSGLKRIEIPDSVTKIADNAFDGISGLTIVSSSGSYAQQYADQHSQITWENSAPPVSVTKDSPLNRDNILALLDAINPNGAYIIRHSSESSLTSWFGSAATIGDGINQLSVAVHEQCHDFCGTPASFRYNSITGKYMRANEWIYIGNGKYIDVPLTDVFPSSEMVDTIPESLRTYRFDTYINGDPIMGSIQYGVYGMLDEFTAYCWGNENDILQKDFQSENGLYIWNSNSFLAYAEFRYYILHYMLYAKEHYPAVYKGIMGNTQFLQAYSKVESQFAGFADIQKNTYYMDEWNVLMQEMAKPDYVKMASLME